MRLIKDKRTKRDLPPRLSHFSEDDIFPHTFADCSAFSISSGDAIEAPPKTVSLSLPFTKRTCELLCSIEYNKSINSLFLKAFSVPFPDSFKQFLELLPSHIKNIKISSVTNSESDSPVAAILLCRELHF